MVDVVAAGRIVVVVVVEDVSAVVVEDADDVIVVVELGEGVVVVAGVRGAMDTLGAVVATVGMVAPVTL